MRVIPRIPTMLWTHGYFDLYLSTLGSRVSQEGTRERLLWRNDRAGGDHLGERWAWSLVVVRGLPSRSDRDHVRLCELLTHA